MPSGKGAQPGRLVGWWGGLREVGGIRGQNFMGLLGKIPDHPFFFFYAHLVQDLNSPVLRDHAQAVDHGVSHKQVVHAGSLSQGRVSFAAVMGQGFRSCSPQQLRAV